MTTLSNDPVFPAPAIQGGALGMCLREYFSGLAMQTLLFQLELPGVGLFPISDERASKRRELIAGESVRMAEALIAALNGSGEKPATGDGWRAREGIPD